MTILPAKRSNSNQQNEEQDNSTTSQNMPLNLNIPSGRLSSIPLGINLTQGHSQIINYQEKSNERPFRSRHDEHSRPSHSHAAQNFEDIPGSSKRRNYAFNSKDRYYRNQERKRLRGGEPKQDRDRVRGGEQHSHPSHEHQDQRMSSPPVSTSDKVSTSSPTSREDVTGYNSEDEYDLPPGPRLNEEEWRQRDLIFARSIEKLGFSIKPMIEDGACLFRAIADQVYGDQEMHTVVRAHCMDYILKNKDFFCSYVTEDLNQYVKRKRHCNVHGNHLEIQALSEMYHRTIEVYCYQITYYFLNGTKRFCDLEPINIFHGTNGSDYEPIRLSYHRMSHYNSITNPMNPSVGVGLGLPSYHLPGDIDRRQVNDAVRQSEDQLIEQAMMEDKLKATDWEATNEAIEEQVARESYIQFCKDNEKRRKALFHPSIAGSSSTITSATSCGGGSGQSSRSRASASPKGSLSPKGSSSPKIHSRESSASPKGYASPARNSAAVVSSASAAPGTSYGEASCDNSSKTGTECGSTSMEMDYHENGEEAIFNRLPPEVFGLCDWEDASVMAHVLAASQQEYLDSLKANRGHQHNTSPGPSTSR